MRRAAVGCASYLSLDGVVDATAGVSVVLDWSESVVALLLLLPLLLLLRGSQYS